MTTRRPSQAELRRAERAIWGPPPGPAERPLLGLNYQRIGRGTLVATCSIVIPRWGHLTIDGLQWHRKHDSEWIAFPSREWADQAGARRFAPFIKFADKNAARKFQAVVLALFHYLADEGAL
jgi:hypothetical protein